jgi:hypothetical protein
MKITSAKRLHELQAHDPDVNGGDDASELAMETATFSQVSFHVSVSALCLRMFDHVIG